MRILLINPNTTDDITQLVARHVRAQAGDAATFVPVTGAFGARYIASRAAAAIAAHATLDAFARHGAGCDAVYLACFGDPGLHALHELSPVPVVGMADAACREAATRGRFGIVTGGALWRPMLTEFVSLIGLSHVFTAVRTITPTGADIARDPDAALDALAADCDACAREDGAETVILGGAALAGLAERIQPRVSVPLICSVAAGTRAVLAAAKAGRSDIPPRSPSDSVGLSEALAALIAAS